MHVPLSPLTATSCTLREEIDLQPGTDTALSHAAPNQAPGSQQQTEQSTAPSKLHPQRLTARANRENKPAPPRGRSGSRCEEAQAAAPRTKEPRAALPRRPPLALGAARKQSASHSPRPAPHGAPRPLTAALPAGGSGLPVPPRPRPAAEPPTPAALLPPLSGCPPSSAINPGVRALVTPGRERRA